MIMARTYSKLVTKIDERAMWQGTNRLSYEYIIIHHNAGTSDQNARDTWLRSRGNQTSANYQVTPTTIWGCVPEYNVAYHAGGTGSNDRPKIANINRRSIGIENLNSTGAPSWEIAEATYKNLAKLVSDIAKAHNIPLDRKHVLRHGEVTKTACCGGIDVDRVVAMAKGQSYTPSKPSNPSKPSGKLTEDGWWGKDTTIALQNYFKMPYKDGIIQGQVRQAGNQNMTCISFGKGGSPLIKAIQKKLGVNVDGYLGKDTIKALQKHYGMKYVDGLISGPSPMIKKMQQSLNRNKF